MSAFKSLFYLRLPKDYWVYYIIYYSSSIFIKVVMRKMCPLVRKRSTWWWLEMASTRQLLQVIPVLLMAGQPSSRQLLFCIRRRI